MKKLLLTLIAAGSSIVPVSSSDVTDYAVTDIGVLPGSNSSTATDINKQGQVVGNGADAFLYSAGILKDLGIASKAHGINDAGTVVGYGFVYRDSQVFDFSGVDIRAINNLGIFVGQHYGHAFSSQYGAKEGALLDLGTLVPGGSTGVSIAYGINDSGVIVGSSAFRPDTDIQHAFTWQNGHMTDLGTIIPEAAGYTYSVAYHINKHGQIVGYSNLSGDGPDGLRAFLYENGHMRNLGALPGEDNSWANDINTEGIVVGGSETYGQTKRAFVIIGDKMYNLQTLLIANTGGWVLTEATAINDAGQITARGINSAGVTHALLLNSAR
jgi:probable HAF family extracellular repeat protein